MDRKTLISTIFILAGQVLAGCGGDPLADVPRIQDVDVAAPAPVLEAVAAPAERDEKAGFFQRLKRKRDAGTRIDGSGEGATAVLAAPPAGAGAGSAGAESPAPEAIQAEPKTRRFQLFGKRRDTVETSPDADGDRSRETAAAPTDEARAAETPVETVASRPERKKRGLFGWSRKPAAEADATAVAVAMPAGEAQAVAPPGQDGKPARSQAPRAAGHLRDAVPGEVLPFGDVARACHVKRGQMGKEVAKYPERGAKYRVYDSAPGNLGLHTFYLTGFRDGCARQVTAALAVFGTAGMYETLRYGLPAGSRSKKPTDKAYEKLKSQICGVARTRPCGAKLGKLEKTTVFLSLYNRFEGAQGWTNLLLSDGEVVARDTEG